VFSKWNTIVAFEKINPKPRLPLEQRSTDAEADKDLLLILSIFLDLSLKIDSDSGVVISNPLVV
jgi:hypothetical protein